MLDATTIQALAAFLAVILAAVGLLNGFILWQIRDLKGEFKMEIGRLDSTIDRGQAELREEMRQMEERLLRGQAELREEMRQMEERLLRGQAELREEMRQMEERIIRGQAELREEMRRGFSQLLSSLNGHTHDPDTGAAVFHEVPTAADDD